MYLQYPTTIRRWWVGCIYPDSKIHGTNIGPTWVLSSPGGPHVGPMNLAIRVHVGCIHNNTPLHPGNTLQCTSFSLKSSQQTTNNSAVALPKDKVCCIIDDRLTVAQWMAPSHYLNQCWQVFLCHMTKPGINMLLLYHNKPDAAGIVLILVQHQPVI